MATKTVTFKGKALWCQPWVGQIDRAYEDPDNGRGGKWSMKLIVDKENLLAFLDLGAKAKPKRIDELKKTDGLEDYLDNKFLSFNRNEFVNYGKGPEELGPPKVTGVEEGALIGNLSDVTVTAEAYDYEFKGKTGVAIRWVSLHVDNLIEYKKPSEVPFDTDNTPPVH